MIDVEKEIGIDQTDNTSQFVFDQNNDERPPWSITLFGRSHQIDRSLLAFILTFVVLGPVAISCVIILLTSECDSKTTSIIAILAASMGYIAPRPQQ